VQNCSTGISMFIIIVVVIIKTVPVVCRSLPVVCESLHFAISCVPLVLSAYIYHTPRYLISTRIHIEAGTERAPSLPESPS
jgi:hypothetical protein